MSAPENRASKYARVSELEKLLSELNTSLASANSNYLNNSDEKYSSIFLVGPHRSGSTLLLQWLARTGVVAYPSNLLSRFYGAPLVGAKIQLLLTDPIYNFKDEILDFTSDIEFNSDNGKTKGALAPNEFWYFWRRFLPFGDLDYMPGKKLSEAADLEGLRREISALANIFGKPFALKALIMNQNIPELAKKFSKPLFIWIRRDPIFNIQSALEARKRQYGDMNTWYSFKIKEYPYLKDLDPLQSVAGQIAAINSSVEEGLDKVPESQKLSVEYEDFCRRPEYYFHKIIQKLSLQNGISLDVPHEYHGEATFSCQNTWKLDEYSRIDAERAYSLAKNASSRH